MTPKEKSSELFYKYSDITLNVESDDDINKYTAKQCALIAVDEIINETLELDRLRYWNEVKNEIKKTN